VELICGLCEKTIDKEKSGNGLILTSLCMECRKALAREAKSPCPEGNGAKQYPICQEGFKAFSRKAGS